MDKKFLFIIICGSFFIFFIAVNAHMRRQMRKLSENDLVVIQKNVPLKKEKIEVSPKKISSSAEVVHRIKEDFSNGTSENLFYVGKDVIAHYRTKGKKILKVEGKIPEGKVKFVNETRKTYGEEFYRFGKKDGKYVEYYSKGNIKTEAQYVNGKLKRRKTYFHDGKIRSEEDFQYAMILPLGEYSGSGRIYRSNGTLKFEWNITYNNPEKYTKTYDREGTLIAVDTYDDMGRIIKKGAVIPQS